MATADGGTDALIQAQYDDLLANADHACLAARSRRARRRQHRRLWAARLQRLELATRNTAG